MKVVSAPARFGERGARCFVGRFTLGLDEAAAVFGRKGALGTNLQKRDTRIVYDVSVAVSRFFLLRSGWYDIHTYIHT